VHLNAGKPGLFCNTCGIKVFYVPRSHPDGYSVNLNCIEMDEEVSLEFSEFDGQNWRQNISGLLEEF